MKIKYALMGACFALCTAACSTQSPTVYTNDKGTKLALGTRNHRSRIA